MFASSCFKHLASCHLFYLIGDGSSTSSRTLNLYVGNAWVAFLLKIRLKQVDSCGNVLYERISESLSHWLLLFACSELDQRAWFGVIGCKPYVQTISLLRQDRNNFNRITILPTYTLYLVHVLTLNRKWTQLCKYLPQKKYKVFTC